MSVLFSRLNNAPRKPTCLSAEYFISELIRLRPWPRKVIMYRPDKNRKKSMKKALKKRPFDRTVIYLRFSGAEID